MKYLRELKSITFATVENGIPHARIIDVMFLENDCIYFLTARGKAFYRQLLDSKIVTMSGMGENYKAIRVSGVAHPADCSYVDKIFEANPGLGDIYAPNARDILEAFSIKQGIGEVFDLSEAHPKRYRFAFGGAEVIKPGYFILQDKCIKCKVCVMSCPVGAVSEHDEKINIDGTLCLECGRCWEFCPVAAIEQPKRFELEES